MLRITRWKVPRRYTADLQNFLGICRRSRQPLVSSPPPPTRARPPLKASPGSALWTAQSSTACTSRPTSTMLPGRLSWTRACPSMSSTRRTRLGDFTQQNADCRLQIAGEMVSGRCIGGVGVNSLTAASCNLQSAIWQACDLQSAICNLQSEAQTTLNPLPTSSISFCSEFPNQTRADTRFLIA